VSHLVLGQLRLCSKAGGEWLHATVSIEVVALELEFTLPSSMIVQNTCLTGCSLRGSPMLASL
jgi:hypothetical protein